MRSLLQPKETQRRQWLLLNQAAMRQAHYQTAWMNQMTTPHCCLVGSRFGQMSTIATTIGTRPQSNRHGKGQQYRWTWERMGKLAGIKYGKVKERKRVPHNWPLH